MARALVICTKDQRVMSRLADKINRLNQVLTPDNIPVRKPFAYQQDHSLSVVFNPPLDFLHSNGSFCLGKMVGTPENWWQYDGPTPDGTYAIFRVEKNNLEILTDVVATRTVWYFYSEDLFIASSSQRAIIALLGDFFINPQALKWMISSGSLGPGNSWDSRLKWMPGDSRLILDLQSWELSIATQKIEFTPQKRTKSENKAILKRLLEKSIHGLELDYSKWYLTLSGGYDSRMILLLMPDKKKIQCITWGLENSLLDPRNDAAVAKELVDYYGGNFNYHITETSDEPIGTILNRFVSVGEGRKDEISAYLDGFAIWKSLYQKGISGIIRGDVGFSSWRLFSKLDVARVAGLATISDYRNYEVANLSLMGEQAIPEEYWIRDHENLPAWKDRIYHLYELPIQLGALTEIKSAYVEIINPLLTREVVYFIRTLPQSIRIGKGIFKELVMELSPPVPIADHMAIKQPAHILTDPGIVEIVKTELLSLQSKNLLPENMLYWTRNHLRVSSEAAGQKMRTSFKDKIPVSLHPLLRAMRGKQDLSANQIGFRCFIINRMIDIFEQDARKIQDIRNECP